jgi:hypothetical protein
MERFSPDLRYFISEYLKVRMPLSTSCPLRLRRVSETVARVDDKRNAHELLVSKLTEKKPKQKWKHNIKIDRRNAGCKDNCIHLAVYKVQWQDFAVTMMELLGSCVTRFHIKHSKQPPHGILFLGVFFFLRGGGWDSPLGTSAANWSIVPAPDNRWVGSIWCNNANWQGKRKYLEETSPSATLSTLNTTRLDQGIEPGPLQWEAGD